MFLAVFISFFIRFSEGGRDYFANRTCGLIVKITFYSKLFIKWHQGALIIWQVPAFFLAFSPPPPGGAPPLYSSSDILDPVDLKGCIFCYIKNSKNCQNILGVSVKRSVMCKLMKIIKASLFKQETGLICMHKNKTRSVDLHWYRIRF